MRFKLRGIVGAGLMAVMTPAAAYAAEIDCIVERTPAPLKAEVEALAGSIVMESAPGGEASIAAKLDAQLKSCTATHRWSAAKGKAAMDYAIATLLTQSLRQNLARRGVSLAAIDGVIAANAAVFNPPIGTATATQEQATKVITDATAAGLTIDESETGNLVMTYFGAIAVCNQIKREFEAA